MNKITIFVASLMVAVITGCTRNTDLVEAGVMGVMNNGPDESPLWLLLDHTKLQSIRISGIRCSDTRIAEDSLVVNLSSKRIVFPHPGYISSLPAVSAETIHLVEKPSVTVADILLKEKGCQVDK